MKNLKDSIKEEIEVSNETEIIKAYKRIVTYNFSNNETRESFKSMLDGLKLEIQSDQSTFAQKLKTNPQGIDDLIENIKEWTKNNSNMYEENDFINVYDHTMYHIARYEIKYNTQTKNFDYPQTPLFVMR